MVYIIVRAFTVDITYDEYGSYLYLIDLSFIDLFTSDAAWGSANNHVINTICMQIGNGLLGPEVAAMRWGNVVAGIFYFIFGYRLINLLHPERDYKFLILFFILISVHFGLEFFSLARGYGMVYAMSMALIYYFLKFSQDGSTRYFNYGSLLVCFGLFINLTTSILFASWFVSTFMIYMISQKISFVAYLKKLLKISPAILLTFGVFIKPLSILSKHGEFEYGPEDFTDTFYSLFNNLIAHNHLFKIWDIYNISAVIFGTMFFGIIIYAISTVRSAHWSNSQKYLFYSVGFFVITLVINILTHNLTKANYLTGRTAILYFPLIMTVIVCFINSIENTLLKNACLITVATFSMYCALLQIKLKSCDEWWFDIESKEMAQSLMQDNGKDRPALVSGDWLMMASPNFYLKREGYENIRLENRNINTEADFTVDPTEVKYILIFNNNLSHLKNKYTTVRKGNLAELVRIDK